MEKLSLDEIIAGRKNSSANHGEVQECLLTSVSNIFSLEIFFVHAFGKKISLKVWKICAHFKLISCRHGTAGIKEEL